MTYTFIQECLKLFWTCTLYIKEWISHLLKNLLCTFQELSRLHRHENYFLLFICFPIKVLCTIELNSTKTFQCCFEKTSLLQIVIHSCPILTTTFPTQYLMSSIGLSINIIRFRFPSFTLHLKLHTSFPQSFRHACSDPIPDVNLTSEDGTTINSFTFSAAIMTSSSFGTKTCTTLKINVVEELLV